MILRYHIHGLIVLIKNNLHVWRSIIMRSAAKTQGGVFSKLIKSQKLIRLTGFTTIVLFLLLSIATIIPIYNKVDKAEAVVGTSTESVLNFTSTNSTASVNLTVNSPDGTFATGTASQKAAFSIATNNYTGYTLTLKSSGTTTTLSGASGTIATIPASTTASTFSANTEAGKLLNNKWGYIPNYYNATGTSPAENTTNYYPAPTSSNIATLRTTSIANSTNGTDNADNYTIGLGLRADFTNPAGTYTNDTFILEIVANPIAYSITFADSTGDSSVTNLPAALASSTGSASVTLTNDKTPTRAGYTFKAWCLGTVSNSGTTCTGTEYNASGSFGIDQTADNRNLTLYATWTPNKYTCTKRYRLQNADGTFPDAYTTDTSATEQVDYNSTCTYTKSITDYKGSSSGANGSSGTISGTMNNTNGITLSLDFYRNTYTLTVSAGTNTSSPTGGGTKRWGETATVGVTKASNVTCTSYGTPTWTQSGTAGTFSSTSGTSVNFTMGKGNTTVTATSTASSVAQTITLGIYGGATSIVIDGTAYTTTGSTALLTCGNHSVYGTFNSGYELYYWSYENVAVANWAATSTTITVSRSGILALTGKASCIEISGYMQNFSSSNNYCATSGTLTDQRDSKSYTIAKIGNLWWMTKNLDLAGGSALTSTTSNISDNYTLPGSQLSFNSYTAPKVYNSGSTVCSSSSYCYSYYNYVAACAGNNPSSGTCTYDICPKNWRLPTKEEFDQLGYTYANGNNLIGSPFYAVYAGNPTYGERGNYGLYISATANGTNTYYSFDINSDAAYTHGGRYKKDGISIRCVAK